MRRLLLSSLVVLAGCAASDSLAPERASPAPAGPVADDRPPAPVVRLVAGRPDTVVVADLFAGAQSVSVPSPDGPVRARSLGDGRLVLEAEAMGLALVPLVVDGEAVALAVEAAVQPEVTFRFVPDLTTADAPLPEVFVIGGFNDWSRSATPLVRQPDGALAATVPITPGRYEYKLTVDGAEVLDPASADSVANPFGAYNNVLVVAPPVEGGLVVRVVGEAPGDPSQLRLAVRSVSAQGAESLPAELDDDEDVVALDGNRVLDDNAVYFDPDSGELAIDLDAMQPGLRRLRVAARGGGRVSPWVEIPVAGHRALAARADAPFVWNDAVIYQIVVDRFDDGDPTNSRPVVADSLDRSANYQGGDLAGVLARLRDGTFDRLGVNVLWLSPLVDNPETAYREYPAPHRYYTGYHGYWPVQSRAVEERFGTMDDLRAVVDEAHRRDIRVLLDFVANHVHESHPYVAAHPDWFGTLELPDGSLNLRRWDDYRLTTWFEPYLPSFDFVGAPAAIAQVTDDAAWWLRESGADGFRQDAVKHIPLEFWRALTARLAGDGERPFQIGETFGSYDLVSSYVAPGLLNAQFNFALYDTAVSAFARGGSLRALADELDASLRVFGPLHTMGNPIDSHDKPRFPALVEGDDLDGWSANPPTVDSPETYRRQALALAYTLTTPGIPIVYYGDEIGLTGGDDPDNRRMMVWDGLTPDQLALRDRVRQLVRLRRETPALRVGTFETVHADDRLWVYRRTAPGSDVLVALSTGETAVDLDVAVDAATLADFAEATDPLREAAGRWEVPAGGARVWVRELP